MAGPQTSPAPYPDQYTLQPNVEFIFTSDESWSHVEDMTLRRRIQNKAAQRRYRTFSPQFQFSIVCLTKVPIRPQNERTTSNTHSGEPKPRIFSDGASLRSALVSRFCTGAKSDSNGRAHSGAIVELGNKCVFKRGAE